MTVLLYAITDGDASTAPETCGLDDRPLRTITCANLAAIVSDIDSAPTPEEDTFWAYEEVIERLLDGARALLPARFGTVASDDSEIAAMLEERAEPLRAALERVRGAVEYAVHLPRPLPHEDSERPGTAYLTSRLAHTRELTALAEHARAYDNRTAFLVDASSATEFVQQARALGATVTGPWPPYSFVRAPA